MALDIFAAKDAFGARVNLLEAQAVADLQAAYGATWERLRASYEPLAQRVNEAVKAGQPPRPGDLYRMERFTALMAEAESAYKNLAQLGASIGQGMVEASLDAAIEDYRNSLAAMQKAGVVLPNGGWDVSLNREAVLAGLGYTSKGSPLHDLFSKWGDAAAASTRRALVTGVVAGKGTAVIAKDIRRILGTNLWRSQLIARTEAHRIYREVGRQTAAQNPDAFDGWMWRAACDARTCAVCWSKHGTVYPTKVPMHTHPGCRCALVPVPRTFASIVGEPVPDVTAAFKRTGADLFAKLPAARQRAILGPRRFDLYQKGFPLSSFVEDGAKTRWGATPRLVPLKYMPANVSALGPQVVADARSLGAGAQQFPGYPAWVNNAAKKRRVDRYLAANPGVAPARVPRWAIQPGAIPGTAPARARPGMGVNAPRPAGGAPAPAAPIPNVPRAPMVPGPILAAGRNAQWVEYVDAQGVVRSFWHPDVPAGGRFMTNAEIQRNQRHVRRGVRPLEWDPIKQQWRAPTSIAARARAAAAPGPAPLPPVPNPVAPPRPPQAFPPVAAHFVPHPDLPGVQVPVPRQPTGARPMNRLEVKRQYARQKAGLDDLVWKPLPGGGQGHGHWGRPPGAQVTPPTSHGGIVRLSQHGGGHGIAAPRPAGPAPAPVAHAPRGGKAPPNWMQGVKRRRWLRWQAEHPMAPAWQEPPKAYLNNPGPSTIKRDPNRVKRVALNTPVFPRGKGPTGALETRWGGIGGRAQPGGRAANAAAIAQQRAAASAARHQQSAAVRAQLAAMPGHPPLRGGARPMNPAQWARHQSLLRKGLPGMSWTGFQWEPGKVPTVLQPLPVPPPVLPPADRTKWTGDIKGMPPEVPMPPMPALPPGSKSYEPSPRVKRDLDTMSIKGGDFSYRSAGGVSESYVVTLHDPTGIDTRKALIKPTSGNSPTAAGRVGIKGKTETEREYAGYVVNRWLGFPIQHQTSSIRDFGTFHDPVTRKDVRIGRAVVNDWLTPPAGWEMSGTFGGIGNLPMREQIHASLFDSLILNTDRHGSNYFIWKNKATGEYHLVAIDPSLAFPYVPDGNARANTTAGAQNWTDTPRTLDAEAKVRLRYFLENETLIRQELEPLLGRVTTDGVFMRARWIWQHGRTPSSRELANLTWWDPNYP